MLQGFVGFCFVYWGGGGSWLEGFNYSYLNTDCSNNKLPDLKKYIQSEQYNCS